MAKSTRMSKRAASAPTPVQQAQVVEASASSEASVYAGVAIVATLVFLVACIMMDHELGPLGSGLFFKG
ncbi:MAG: hypothetical protein HZA52_01780 [Planctomycetes bacterium]|nr:hypothetical protein [Planctomycetota bacterium]